MTFACDWPSGLGEDYLSGNDGRRGETTTPSGGLLYYTLTFRVRGAINTILRPSSSSIDV